LKYRVFRLLCGGLPERRLDEALVENPLAYGGNAYQHAVEIVNGIYVDEDQKRSRHRGLLANQAEVSEPIYSFIERFQDKYLRAEDMGLGPKDIQQEILSCMDCDQ